MRYRRGRWRPRSLRLTAQGISLQRAPADASLVRNAPSSGVSSGENGARPRCAATFFAAAPSSRRLLGHRSAPSRLMGEVNGLKESASQRESVDDLRRHTKCRSRASLGPRSCHPPGRHCRRRDRDRRCHSVRAAACVCRERARRARWGDGRKRSAESAARRRRSAISAAAAKQCERCEQKKSGEPNGARRRRLLCCRASGVAARTSRFGAYRTAVSSRRLRRPSAARPRSGKSTVPPPTLEQPFGPVGPVDPVCPVCPVCPVAPLQT